MEINNNCAELQRYYSEKFEKYRSKYQILRQKNPIDSLITKDLYELEKAVTTSFVDYVY